VALRWGRQLLYWLHVILDLHSINQLSRHVHHNRVWARVQPPSGYHFRQLSSNINQIANLHTSEATKVGKRLAPQQSHAFKWVRDCVRVIAADHHAINKVEEPSLDGIWHHPLAIPHQSSTHHVSSCFLVSSQTTISLRQLPPYAPRNETSIFVAFYGRCRVRSHEPRFPPPMMLWLGGCFEMQSTGKYAGREIHTTGWHYGLR